jgi:hypothetical protein
MGYDEFDSYSSSSILSTMSGKKLTAIVVIVIVGAFFVIQAIFGFPIRDVFRKDITDQAKVVIKDSSGTCIVEPSDKQPRSIPNCPYKVGDTLSVTFKEGTDHIEKFAPKS